MFCAALRREISVSKKICIEYFEVWQHATKCIFIPIFPFPLFQFVSLVFVFTTTTRTGMRKEESGEGKCGEDRKNEKFVPENNETIRNFSIRKSPFYLVEFSPPPFCRH